MFISNCGKNPVSYGQLAEHLVRALLLLFLLFVNWYLFPYKHWNISMFFLRYITELITFSLPLNRKKKKKKTGSWSCSAGVANVRTITDQIFPGLKKMLSILLGFRKHVRYVACMRARKLSLDSETLFVLSPGQIIYQRSISSVYSLRDRQIETTEYTVFSSQPKLGSDIQANHITAHSKDVTTDIYIVNIWNSYFFIYLSCFLSIIYFSYKFLPGIIKTRLANIL